MAQIRISYRHKEKFAGPIESNELNDLDIIYSNPDSLVLDFAVHLFADEMARRGDRLPGGMQRAAFVSDVLGYFPDENRRLIQDVSDQGFLERFLGDTSRFMRQNLATGAKKEILIYLIGLVLDRFEPEKDNLLLVLMDEFESGINVLRQKLMVDSLIHILERLPQRTSQVKVVLTTHSPVVFSELGSRPDLVDVYYVLRDVNAPSRIYPASSERKPDDIDKRILLELGLSIFDLPQRLLFVEGDTDAFFFGEIFEDCHIVPLYGGSFPKILGQLLGSLRLAWEKSYVVVVDNNKIMSILAGIGRIHDKYGKEVTVDVTTHGYDSLEEYLLDIKLSGRVNAVTLWARLQARFEAINTEIRGLNAAPFDYDIPVLRARLGQRGKEGVGIFLASLKKNQEFYEVMGKFWRRLLSPSARKYISELQMRHQLTYRKS